MSMVVMTSFELPLCCFADIAWKMSGQCSSCFLYISWHDSRISAITICMSVSHGVCIYSRSVLSSGGEVKAELMTLCTLTWKYPWPPLCLCACFMSNLLTGHGTGRETVLSTYLILNTLSSNWLPLNYTKCSIYNSTILYQVTNTNSNVVYIALGFYYTVYSIYPWKILIWNSSPQCFV